jgi:hypothetical protein
MRWRDSLLLLVLVFLAWQVMYLLVGDVALRSPAATVQNLKILL